MTAKPKRRIMNKDGQDGQDRGKISTIRRIKYVPRQKHVWPEWTWRAVLFILCVIVAVAVFWSRTAHGAVTSWTDEATSGNGRAQYDLLYNAVRVVTPADLATAATPGILDAVTTASDAQKMAVRMAIAKFAAEQSGTQACVDMLNYILYGTWDEVGAVESTAITREQREGILHAVLAAAKSVCQTEGLRLMAVALADGATSAPVGW